MLLRYSLERIYMIKLERRFINTEFGPYMAKKTLSYSSACGLLVHSLDETFFCDSLRSVYLNNALKMKRSA